MNPNQRPQMPDQTWSVTKEEKEKIVAFGRELTQFVFKYANEHKENGKFHTKLVAGAFQYFMDLQKQKAQLVGDDLLISNDTVYNTDLAEQIDEPFVDDEIPEESAEDKVKRLTDELAAAEQELRGVKPGDADVEDASLSPETSQPASVPTAQVAEETQPAPEVETPVETEAPQQPQG